MSLHRREIGTGTPVAFCHGLFGQGRNWTQIAKAVAEDGHRCILLDMPEHGRSDWTDGFSYPEAARLVAAELADDGPLAVVGHSMGGKIAMLLALHHPELVSRLCVADISPVDYDTIADRDEPGHGLTQFAHYIRALRGVNLETLSGRGDADRLLTDAVPDPSVRGFLLQNLRRDGDRWRWQLNLDGLGESLDRLSGWPDQAGVAPYPGPVLWIAGADSRYVRPEFSAGMRALFPRVAKATIKDAGHWVHSEQPEVFAGLLRRFLS